MTEATGFSSTTRRADEPSMVFGVRALAACGFLCLALAIVLVWRIGPVVYSATPEHGLHLGDMLALPALAAAALNLHPLPVRR